MCLVYSIYNIVTSKKLQGRNSVHEKNTQLLSETNEATTDNMLIMCNSRWPRKFNNIFQLI